MTSRRAINKYLRRSEPGQRNYLIVQAQFPLGTTGQLEKPRLGIIYADEPTAWYHGPGPTCITTSGMRVIKTYPTYQCDYFEDWDEATVEFMKESPPVPGLEPTAGWLSPEGAFYPCKYAEHDSMAARLHAVIYSQPGGTRYLEEHGWLRVDDNGYIVLAYHLDREAITKAQRDTLLELRAAADQLGLTAYADSIYDRFGDDDL